MCGRSRRGVDACAGAARDTRWAGCTSRGWEIWDTRSEPLGCAAASSRCCCELSWGWDAPWLGQLLLGFLFPPPLYLPYHTMDIFFFLAVYEESEQKVWQNNGRRTRD